MEWFKDLQRKAGVTNEKIGTALGRDRTVVSRIYAKKQQMTWQQAQVFAAELGVDVADVLFHAGLAGDPPKSLPQPGFAESDARPWKEDGDDAKHIRSMADFLGAGRPGVDIWQVQNRAMILDGYMPGDFMLVDHNASDRAKPGNIVIAQVYDWASGSALTILRRYEPPVLVSSGTDASDRKPYVVDGQNVIIRGLITASWRETVKH